MEKLLQWVRIKMKNNLNEDVSAYSDCEKAWMQGYLAALEAVELKIEAEIGE